MSNDVYQVVTDRVIEMLEAGVVPWRKPWKPGAQQRSVLGHTYRGINVFLLEMEAQARGYSSPFWITFKQAKERGGSVKKGERSTLVVFWKRLTVTEKGRDEEKRIPMLRYYRVFNLDQTEDVKVPAVVANWEPPPPVLGMAGADAILARYLADKGPWLTESDSQEAYYQPATDNIVVPSKGRYANLSEFYSTAYHEVIHSTGHPSRLARYTPAAFGSHTYGLEELVAEMGATMLAGEAGIAEDTIANSAAYLGSWLRTIREDPKCLVKAAGQAQKAADLVLGRTFDEPETTVPASLSEGAMA